MKQVMVQDWFPELGSVVWGMDFPILVFDFLGSPLAVNPFVENKLKQARVSWRSMPWSKWFHPWHDLELEDLRQSTLREDKKPSDFEAEIALVPECRTLFRWRTLVGYNLKDEGRIACIGLEVPVKTPSPAIDTDEHLLLTRILDHTTDGTITINTKGLVLSFNRAAEHLFGYRASEVLGKNVSMLMPSPHREKHDGYLENYLTTREAKIIGKGREVLGRRKNGETFPFLLTTTKPFQIGKQSGFLGIVRDLSQTKSIENQLRRAQKMESIGTLAGGIAHDFNNILGGLSGYIELMLESAEPGGFMEEDLMDMKKACQRGRDLVQQILTFSRRDRAELEPMRVQPIVLESLKLLRATLPATISIVEDVSELCPSIVGDVSQIHQILMNLGTNAYHAMRKDGGQLTISLKHIFLDERFKGPKPDLPFGEYNLLQVKDTGQGIRPELLSRIFDPFFTTKPVGEGSGMGLAVVHGIAQSHQGDITVESEIGKGSCFSIFFPVQQADTKEVVPNSGDLNGGEEHLVLVDDDGMLLRVQTRILQRAGYHVTAFDNAQKALSALLDPDHSFDLLLTDQTMPEVTGLEIAQQIHNFKPEFPIILTTGYSDVVSTDVVGKYGIRDLLMKPVSKANLTKAIRSVFDNS